MERRRRRRRLAEGRAWKVVLLVGETGSGKSHTIKLLDGKNAEGLFPEIANDVESCTVNPEIFKSELLRLFLIDTPGFNDTRGVCDGDSFRRTLQTIRHSERIGPYIKVLLFLVKSGSDKKNSKFQEYCEMINSLGTEIWKRVIVVVKRPGRNLRVSSKGVVAAIREISGGHDPTVVGWDFGNEDAETEEEKYEITENDPKRNEYTKRSVRTMLLGSIHGFRGYHTITFMNNECKTCGIVDDKRCVEENCHEGIFRFEHPGDWGKVVSEDDPDYDYISALDKTNNGIMWGCRIVGGVAGGVTGGIFGAGAGAVGGAGVGAVGGAAVGGAGGSAIGGAGGEFLGRCITGLVNFFGGRSEAKNRVKTFKVWSCCRNPNEQAEGCQNLCSRCGEAYGTPPGEGCGAGEHDWNEE